MDNKQVEKIAKLARLQLTVEEIELFRKQLDSILEYVSQLDELDTAKINTIGQPLLDKLRMRDDTLEKFENIDGLTGVAPDFRDGFYGVKKVIE
ncbi:Asp-tRNA(Asn)/Glu-tRNA(Gln) amidotransferase subunit GatC [Elusimicrobiota bacterium]